MEQSSIYIHLYNDLCERIPYRPLVEYGGYVMRLIGYEDDMWVLQQHIEPSTIHTIKVQRVDDIKPYLRPMDSMTDAERKELMDVSKVFTHDFSALRGTKWLIARHFDYRYLIPNELALEAPEGMYDTKIQ